MNNDEIKFAKRIKELRLSKDMTMEELGNKLGKTKSTISTWEKGSRSPKMGELEDIASFFNVSINYLLGLSDTDNKKTFELTNKKLDELQKRVEKNLQKNPNHKEFKEVLEEIERERFNAKVIYSLGNSLDYQYLKEYGISRNEVVVLSDENIREPILKMLELFPKLNLEDLNKILEYTEMLNMKRESESK
ncbi:MAG: helix-turn-helix domain-containing protein [Lactococcus cremoris]|nr:MULTISPECIES: helix-turn-helix transcriptional regulator [Lactococcus]MDS1013746.1 helix-turn-helix transcriptional regulator [Lactococcus lactis]TKD78914.1 helix-turn-helix transcriptional regulator [Lactococcus lactis]TNU77969.1 helix-turn-helix transcriptional regulator [Lactococcus cremoris]UXV68221.1 helix-turn-helix transcriptional regulator [Lactococcus lactis subsp. lactis]